MFWCTMVKLDMGSTVGTIVRLNESSLKLNVGNSCTDVAGTRSPHNEPWVSAEERNGPDRCVKGKG